MVPFQLREERLCICARAFISDRVDHQLSPSATENSTHLRGFKQHTLIVVLLSKSKSKIGLPELKSRSWHSPGPSGSSWEMLFPWLSQAADCPTLWLVALSIFKAHTVDHMFLHGSLLGLLFCSAELLLVHQGTLISRSSCLSSGQVTNNTSVVLQTHLSLIVIYS